MKKDFIIKALGVVIAATVCGPLYANTPSKPYVQEILTIRNYSSNTNYADADFLYPTNATFAQSNNTNNNPIYPINAGGASITTLKEKTIYQSNINVRAKAVDPGSSPNPSLVALDISSATGSWECRMAITHRNVTHPSDGISTVTPVSGDCSRISCQRVVSNVDGTLNENYLVTINPTDSGANFGACAQYPNFNG